MGWLERIEAPTTIQGRSPWDERWWTNAPQFASGAGIQVSPEAALTLSAVWAAVKILTEDLSSIPFVLYQRDADGGRTEAEQHALWEVLQFQANNRQTALEFWEMETGHLLLRGNAYARLVEGRRGFADQLEPLNPDRMEPHRLPSGRIRYDYTRPDGTEQKFTEDEIMHLKGFSSDGMRGLSVIQYAAQSFGTAMAADHYAANFFGDGATPSAVLSSPGRLKPGEQDNLRASIREYTGGVRNSHGFLVLEDGISWQQIGIKPEEAQLLASREYSVEEVARWFNLPVHKLRVNKQAQTFASVEAFNTEYVVHSLRPLARRVEQAVRRDLIIQTRKFFAEFRLTELLRASTKERTDYYHTGILDGWLNRNEVRRAESFNPGPDELDEFLEPRAMVPAGGQTETGAAQMNGSPAATALVREAASAVVSKEIDSATRAAARYAKNPQGWERWVKSFYGRHANHVSTSLHIDKPTAQAYCQHQSQELLQAGVPAMEHWEVEAAEVLARLVTDGEVRA